jgi:hypothetical protein
VVLKSRQKPVRIVTSKTGVEVERIYCRRCMQNKVPRDFWSAVDTDVDKNGYFSVCADCVNEMFDNALTADGSIESAVLKICRKLNIKYSETAIESAKKQMDTYREAGKTLPPFFSIYKIKLVSTQRTGFTEREVEDLTYSEVTSIIVNPNLNTLKNVDEEEIDKSVILFWGAGYNKEDYQWLESMMDGWKKTHKSDTMSEQVLLREIVLKQFEIERARQEKKSTTSLLKDLQDLMKTSAVDPSKANAASSGRSSDTFSSFIKMIEENRPAEYYKDKNLFEDFDGIEDKYFNKHVTRPMKNFITGSRDFSLEDTDEEDDEDVVIDTAMGEDSAESEV